MYLALSSSLGAGRPGFTPLRFSPALWLDAADANTLYDSTVGGSLVAADGTVARWEDKSGNGRHATQGTGVSQPLRKTAVQNGKDVVRFDGANDSFATAVFTTSAGVSIFIATKASNWNASAYRPLVTHGYSQVPETTGTILYGVAGAGVDWSANDYLALGSGYTAPQTPRAFGAAAAGSNYRLLTAQLGGSKAKVYVNGIDSSTTESPGACTVESDNLLVANDGFGNYWDGDIAEILVYPTALTDDQREQVERYLSIKWGIALA